VGTLAEYVDAGRVGLEGADQQDDSGAGRRVLDAGAPCLDAVLVDLTQVDHNGSRDHDADLRRLELFLLAVENSAARSLGRLSRSGRIAATTLSGLASATSLRRLQREPLEVRLPQVSRADGIAVSGVEELLVECGTAGGGSRSAVLGVGPRDVGADSAEHGCGCGNFVGHGDVTFGSSRSLPKVSGFRLYRQRPI